MEGGHANGCRLELDWDKLLPINDNGSPPPMLVTGSEPRRTEVQPPADDQRHLNDHQLAESYQSKLRTFEATAKNLPDKGEKLRVTIKHLEDELRRRREWRRPEKNRKLMSVRSPKKLQPQPLSMCLMARDKKIYHLKHGLNPRLHLCFAKKLKRMITGQPIHPRKIFHLLSIVTVRKLETMETFYGKDEREINVPAIFPNMILLRMIKGRMHLWSFDWMIQNPGRPLYLMMRMKLLYWRKNVKRTNLMNA